MIYNTKLFDWKKSSRYHWNRAFPVSQEANAQIEGNRPEFKKYDIRATKTEWVG